MDKNKEIKARLDQIVAATEGIVSIGAQAAMQNTPQLLGIQRAANEIWKILNSKEETADA